MSSFCHYRYIVCIVVKKNLTAMYKLTKYCRFSAFQLSSSQNVWSCTCASCGLAAFHKQVKTVNDAKYLTSSKRKTDASSLPLSQWFWPEWIRLPKTPSPPTRLKIYTIYWIGAKIPKCMQLDQVGIKSVIVLVNKGSVAVSHWLLCINT